MQQWKRPGEMPPRPSAPRRRPGEPHLNGHSCVARIGPAVQGLGHYLVAAASESTALRGPPPHATCVARPPAPRGLGLGELMGVVSSNPAGSALVSSAQPRCGEKP